MRESRIVAVNHVEMETRAGCEEALRWFYTELVGLDLIEEPPQAPTRVRFRSAELELRYSFLPQPKVESTAHRVILLVDSLWETRKVLAEARIAYTPVTGIAFTDRLLSLLDPGGNRVAIRQAWRSIV